MRNFRGRISSTATSGRNCGGCGSRPRPRRRITSSCGGRISTSSAACPRRTKRAAFLADKSPERRAKLIDHLLQRPEYADFWANKWADLLRPNPYRVGIKAVLNFDAWIRDSFRRNKPYDQFVRELVTAQGSTFRNGAVTLFRDRRSPDEITTIVSQLFLGIRLECAKCHHHPFEVWGQDDFYSFAAYFAKIGRKGTGLSPPISGSEEIVFTAKTGSVKHPLTGEDAVAAAAVRQGSEDRPERRSPRRAGGVDHVGGEPVLREGDRQPRVGRPDGPRAGGTGGRSSRHEPADQRPAAGRAGRRLPPAELRPEEADPPHRDLVRLRLELAPQRAQRGRHAKLFAALRQRLRAEVLLDAVAAITGVPESFDAMPAGSRAMQMWTHRIPSLFLDAFGRPDPNQDPPCERTGDTTVVQALHLMNSQKLAAKITSDKGRAAQLAASKRTPGGDRRGTVPAGLLAVPVGGGTQNRRRRLRKEGSNSAAGDRRPAVGADEYAGVCVQRLRCYGTATRDGRLDPRKRNHHRPRHVETIDHRPVYGAGGGQFSVFSATIFGMVRPDTRGGKR